MSLAALHIRLGLPVRPKWPLLRAHSATSEWSRPGAQNPWTLGDQRTSRPQMKGNDDLIFGSVMLVQKKDPIFLQVSSAFTGSIIDSELDRWRGPKAFYIDGSFPSQMFVFGFQMATLGLFLVLECFYTFYIFSHQLTFQRIAVRHVSLFRRGYKRPDRIILDNWSVWRNRRVPSIPTVLTPGNTLNVATLPSILS